MEEIVPPSYIIIRHFSTTASETLERLFTYIINMIFSRTILSTAVLTVFTMGSAIANEPQVPGFQYGVASKTWALTAGNAMDATEVDIQANNQLGGGSR